MTTTTRKLTNEEKLEIFNKSKVENFKASTRLEIGPSLIGGDDKPISVHIVKSLDVVKY